MYLERPAVLTELVDGAAAIIGNYGSGDVALLDVLFGRDQPQGSLPFDLPRSMTAVEKSREDVPFDTEDPCSDLVSVCGATADRWDGFSSAESSSQPVHELVARSAQCRPRPAIWAGLLLGLHDRKARASQVAPSARD